MAFVDQTDEEKNAQGQALNPLAQAPQTAGGAVSGPGGGVASAVPPGGVGSQPAASKAAPVQNLTAYLQANAPQAQSMGNTVAANLAEGATKAQDDLSSAQQAFEGQVAAGSTPVNQTLINQAAANPTQFVKNPDNVSSFQKQRDASYAGPANFEGSDFYSNLNSEITNAVAKAGSTDPNDLRGIVQRMETNPTPGMTALDSLVLQQSPEAIQTIKGAQAPYATLAQALQDLTTKENAGVQTARTATAAAPGAVKSVFDPLTQTFKSGLTAAQQAAQEKANAYNTDLQRYISYLNQNQPFNAALNASGLNSLIGGNPFTPAPAALSNAPTLSNVASSDDFSKQAALEQLLGTGYQGPLNEAEASEAGTFGLPGTVPQNEDILSILDNVANAERAKLQGQLGPSDGETGITLPTDPRDFTQILGSFNTPEVHALRDLLVQVHSLYPNYVTPVPFVNNEYQLVS